MLSYTGSKLNLDQKSFSKTFDQGHLHWFHAVLQNQRKSTNIVQILKLCHFWRPEKFQPLLKYIMPPYTVVTIH